jgi:ABC-type glutathione transport system ATPase component
MGGRGGYILTRHLTPAVAPLVIPQFVRAATIAILLEASLSFLGLGDPAARSWGTILFYANARSAFLMDAWLWWVVPPGVCIALAVLGFALVGFALEERVRPRLRALTKVTGNRLQVTGVSSPSPATPSTGLEVHGAVGMQGPHRPPFPSSPRPLGFAGSPRPRERGLGGEGLLDVQDLVVEYVTPSGVVRAVNGIRFSIKRGEALGIVGESGSGKTTVVGAVLGLLRSPAQFAGGRVLFDGQDLGALAPSELRRLRGGRIALVPQSAMNALNPVMTVADQIVEAITIHQGRGKRAARVRAGELLELVGIPSARAGAYPHELSGGMRQRVVIAMALANEPELIVADEPTTGLDLLVQAEILALLADLRSRLGLSLLFISHDLPVVLRVVDRLAVMYRGQIVEQGPAQVVAANPGHAYTQRLLASIPKLHEDGPLPPTPSPAAAGEGEWKAAPLSREAREGLGEGAAPPILALQDVHKSFAGRGWRAGRAVVLDGVSFEVQPGEAVGLIGGSGAGKSTIARLVLGLDRPDSGRILFEGEDVGHLAGAALRAARSRLHLVFQDPYEALPPSMRVSEIVAEPLAIHGIGTAAERSDRVREALEAVALTPVERVARRFPHELSGGERQRVALARAVVLQPRLIVADEPTTMLDVSLRLELLDLMRRLARSHAIAFLYITHDLALARAFCDRLVVLHQGKVVEQGATAEVIERPSHPFSRALLAAAEGMGDRLQVTGVRSL